MKRLKQNIHRLMAATLLVCFCLSTPSTTYAMDGNVTSLDTQLREWNGSRNSKGYGYKIKLFYATSNVDFHPGCDPLAYGVSLPTVYGFSGVSNPFTTVASPATEQVRVVPKELSIEDMGALKVTPEKLSVNVWDTAAIVASASKIQTPGGDAICSAIGPPEVELAATLRKQFKSDSPFLRALLKACANGGDTSSLARKVYASIKDKDLKQEIGEKIPWSAQESTQNSVLQKYVLPCYPTCMVSWAAYVSPMRQTELTAGSKANPMLSPIFNNYMGTAHDYAYANGATRAAATQLLTLGKELEEARTAYATGSDAGAGAVNDITLAEESVIEKAIEGNQGNIEKMAREGEFGWQLNKIVYESLPNSLYNTEALWGVPVGSPKGSYDDPGIAYGMGIGLFWQDHKHAVQKTLAPCCEPVDWPAGVDYPTAYCPCGGEGSPRCKCGDKCNPEVFSCDCAQKKVEETVGNPLIDERHLAQLLQKTNFAKGSETVSMTYKPAPNTTDGFVRGEHSFADGNTEHGTSTNWQCTAYTCKIHALKWETTKTPLAFSIPSESYTLYSKMVNDPGSTGSKFALMQMDDKPLLRFDGGVEQFAVPMTQTVEQEDAKLGAHYQKELSAKWISHRWAIPGTQDTTVLAKYMAGEEANKAYKRFMDKAGCGPVKEANTYKTSPSNSNIASKFEMAFHIGNNEDLVVVPPNLARPATYNPVVDATPIVTAPNPIIELGLGEGPPIHITQTTHTPQCSAALEKAPPPVHEPNSIQSAILNKYECKTDVDVQAMYYGKPRTAVLYDKAPTASCGGGSATLTSPSSTFTFNPTYRMYADYDPAGTPSASNKDGAPVDMLGHVRRSARFQNKLNITCSIGKPDVIAPWSRDQEDLGVRTMKASNAYKYTQGATRIHAVGTFYLLDPDFTENPGTQKKINDLVTRQYVQQFEQLGTGFSSSNIQLETQLYNATSVSPKQKGGTGKEALYLEDKDGSGVSVNTATVNLPGNGFVTVTGKGYGGRGDSNSLLVANLQTGGGNKVKDWYNEDFDGIQEVTLTATFGVGPLETGYASVHPRQSDWQTKSESYKITPVVSIGSVSWGEASLSNIQFRPTSTSFNVRGSVFDTVN